MTKKVETFEHLMESFRYQFDVQTAFDDFLTIALCAVTRDANTGLSVYEDLYLETIAKYKDSELRFKFPDLFGVLITEMDNRAGSGNDVLGEYFERNVTRGRGGQYFTPWPVCKLMTSCVVGDQPESSPVLRILDPACGSGRMLLAGSETHGKQHYYYGIDIDQMCVKMAILNLFLNGVFHAEVMCADALKAGDFRISYRTSFLPLGIFRITEKEQSQLWHRYQSYARERTTPVAPDLSLPSEDGDSTIQGTQLNLF